MGNRHKRGADEKSWKEACHEQIADRLLGGNAVLDQADAGRDDNAKLCGRSDSRCSEVPVIVVLKHFRDNDRAYGGGSSGAGAGDSGEKGAGRYGYHGQASWNMA